MKPFQVKIPSNARSTLLAGLLSLTFGAQADDPMDLTHRNLFALCAPMNFIVEPVKEHLSRKIGLADEVIENEIETRLRAAHLYNANASQYLSVNVNLSDSGDFFGPSLSLNRYVNDMGFGIGGFVTVWNTGTVGMHDGNSKHILNTVTLQLDKFITNYLRVNEMECSHK